MKAIFWTAGVLARASRAAASVLTNGAGEDARGPQYTFLSFQMK